MAIQAAPEEVQVATKPLLQVQGLTMSYGVGDSENKILNDLNLEVNDGEFVSIVGPSGVGKTTLLRCLSGLIQPRSGTVSVGGEVINGPHRDLAVVFQDYSRSLMPWMTTLENVAFPLQGRGVGKKERNETAEKNLAAVGLAGQGHKYPWEMSGGMQQRVAIARALVTQPAILFADEPTGNLDSETSAEVLDHLRRSVRELGQTVVMVTHEASAAAYADEIVTVMDGHIEGVTR